MKRAIAIRRVSQVGKRDRDKLSSPDDQRDKIAKFAPDDWEVDYPEPELNVSGDALLANRPQLSRAVMAVQTGQAQVIVAADTSRLWWNQETKAEVLRLVEAAGGEVWTVDTGRLSNVDPVDELNGTVGTAVDRFSRRQNRNKSWAAVERKIAEGIVPYRNVTPGYRKLEDGRWEPDPATRKIVAKAVKMRANGDSIAKVRRYLWANGIQRSHAAVYELMHSEVLIGELHFGKHTPNPRAFDGIVDRDVWERAQTAKVPPGRRAKSERILARLGILRCSGCGARLVVGASGHGKYPNYHCPPTSDCERRVTIVAGVAEEVVIARARELLSGAIGFRSARDNIRQARLECAQAKEALDTYAEVFNPVQADLRSAKDRFARLQRAYDAAHEALRAMEAPADEDVLLLLSYDWEKLSMVDQRRCLKAMIKEAVVQPPTHRGQDPRERIEVIDYGFDWDAYPRFPTDLS